MSEEKYVPSRTIHRVKFGTSAGQEKLIRTVITIRFQLPFSDEFLAHVYCGQTAGWINLPLGVEVGLGPSQIVLDGDPAPPTPKEHRSPQFSAHICCGQITKWIKMPLRRKLGLDPSDIVSDGDPAPPPPKRGQSPANFRPMSLVAKRLDELRYHLVCR